MNTINQTDTKSNRIGSNDENTSQPAKPFSKLSSSSRSSSSYLYSSALATSYDGFFVDEIGSSSLTSPYDHSDFKDYEERHDDDVELLSPETIREPTLLAGPHYPMAQHFRQHQHQQLHQQRSQQHWQQQQQHILQHELRLQEQLHNQRLQHHPSEYDQDLNDDNDRDAVERDVEQDPLQHEQMEQLTSRAGQRLARSHSTHEIHSSNFITEDEFLMLAEDYLLSLSPKKREKALLTNSMYQKILMVLLQPKNTQVSTAQFRFWAKKMFTLSTTETHHIVCHGGKPVATKECLYDVLVYCHRKSSHGGRDKTSAEVRQHYSWVPKELIARFVKHCPLCSSRRHSLQRPPSALGTNGVYETTSSPSGVDTRAETPRIHNVDDSFPGRHRHSVQYSTRDHTQIETTGRSQQQDAPSQQQNRTHSLLQQHYPQALRHQTEHVSHSSQPRLFGDLPHTLRHGPQRSNSSATQVELATHCLGREVALQPDAPSIGPSGTNNGDFISSDLDDRRRSTAWSNNDDVDVDDEDQAMDDDDDDDDEDDMMDDELDYGEDDDEDEPTIAPSRGGGSFNIDGQSLSSEKAAEKHPGDGTDDDCTPSGLVGIHQELRRLPALDHSQRQLHNPSLQQNRPYHQHQQSSALHQQAHTPQQAHGYIQQGYFMSSGSQPPIAATVYHPNGHVLHSRHPMNRLSMATTTYAYGYPYPYSPPAGPVAIPFGQVKSSQEPIAPFAHPSPGTIPSLSAPYGHIYPATLGSCQGAAESEVGQSGQDLLDQCSGSKSEEDVEQDGPVDGNIP